MSELRELRFDHLGAAVDEARELLRSGYTRQGNWSLGQICRHLILVQDPSVDGYPKWMSLFVFMRPVMRRLLLPKVLGNDSPRGIRTASIFVPPADVNDAAEVDAFAKSVERFHAHVGDYAPHPAFGKQSREMIERIHACHAAHHLRFLQPAETSTGVI
ncbi:DUF1569 domain-containing protein [Aporhodopirellula aestuarii]|uniref:DUF1569 domain-containing protein n=1 Tax=Aporhodopirellula aestuarii TaxID=2950107 RepID=A0ABT0TXF2_9BACT|nr:DUF1569 domain-containing protein [Aporhodopirellula aestuarii]MCM2369268.1 DUF1569 domain-containing protein [Aporhodopirellula aestuarii]